MPFDAAWHSDDARRAVDALLRPAAGRAPCSITTVLIRGGEADVDVLFSHQRVLHRHIPRAHISTTAT